MCINNKKIDEFLNITSLFIVLTVLISSFVSLYWLIRPYNPLVINERPIPVVEKQVERGGVVVIELNYCKHTNKEVTIRKKFKDGIIWAVDDIVTADNKEGCRVQTFATPIPHSLPKGEYIMSIDYVYQVNPLKKVIIETYTEKFEVI